MGRVNFGRVVLGGIVAAVIVNVGEGIFGFLMRERYAAAMRALGIRLETRAGLFLPIVWSFVVGIIAIWLYAAIRPRYGPGPKTALRTALAVWCFTGVNFAVAMGSIGIFPGSLMALAAVWSLVEVIVAMLVGAWLYRESDFPAVS
jgi:hypothetical protein